MSDVPATPPPPAVPTVAQLLLDYLTLEDATVIFGVPGAAVMHLLAELRQRASTFRHVVARQETGAAYIADGYARVSGRLGVVLVTSGPGATNALTGTMNAQAAGVPLLTITGEVPQDYYGRGYLQEGTDAGLDVNAVYANASGFSALVTSPANFRTLLERALRDARGLPACAAHLSLPDDVAAAPCAPGTAAPVRSAAYRTRPQVLDTAALGQAFDRLAGAARPVVFLGSGAAAALRDPTRLAAFTAFVESRAWPVMTTPDAKAVFPETHPLSLRCFGVAFCEWTKRYLNPRLIDPALPPGFDGLLVLGTRLGGFATSKWSPILRPAGALCQVDIDADAIGRTMAVDVGVVGEIGLAIDELVRLGQARPADEAAVAGRRALLERVKSVPPFIDPEARHSTASPLHPAAAMAVVSELMPAGSEIFVDAGNCVGWVLHHLVADPPTRVHSALAMGPMGFAVGAVIGARLAAPGRPCLAVCGDGAFLMHGNEVSTAAAQGVGAVWLVLDDGGLGMVAQGMDHFFSKDGDIGRWQPAYALGRNDLVAFAQALGADAYRADDPVSLRRALAAALQAAAAASRPQVVVARIDPVPRPPYYQDPGLTPPAA
ncbi:MAG: thiamine pyrophosphate-binding protein [Betaproteobacteria bacterium]|jgi:acetolactate synthase-1/2/3 large subunit|nr:thiamine pyrophosphate-binding protein [Rubrivivax sp.]MCZ8176998.1 thiamine pyrophosphate-binding protein [Burkholderiaceae bacterium]